MRWIDTQKCSYYKATVGSQLHDLMEIKVQALY